MKVAILILNWNGKSLLEEFLPSVLNFSGNSDVYVLDNGSTDSSVKYVKEKFPSINLIPFKENLGYSKAYNLAVQKVDAEIICCLNSDVEVTKNWINPIVELFKLDHDIASVQPKILDQKNKSLFEYAGAAGGFLDNLGYPYCRGRVFWSLEKDEGQFNDNLEVFWGSGAALFVRKKCFTQVKGFDEDFLIHQEEIDLCWRFKNEGFKNYYCGESTVYHVGAVSLQKQNPKKTFYNFRNNLLMLLKNLPANKLIPVIFFRLILDGITALVFLRYHGFNHLWAIAKAHFSFYFMIPKIWKKRSNKSSDYSNKKFVPYQYFLKRRTTFSDLK